MRRVVAGLVLVATFAISAPTQAGATTGGNCFSGFLGVVIDCGGSIGLTTSPPPPVSAAPPPVPGSSGAAPTIVSVPTLVPGPAGTPCVGFVSTTLAPGQTPPTPGQVSLQVVLQIGVFGLCPNAPVPAAVALNPSVLAAQFWQTIPLPIPHPNIPPGWAITGKPAYLVTHGELNPPAWSEATPLGALQIVAHGQYHVAWGDPRQANEDGPFSVEGAPYPSGTIAHTYDDVGTVTVTVRETWTATWSLGAANGTLQQLETDGTIPGLTVRQVQAVIVG